MQVILDRRSKIDLETGDRLDGIIELQILSTHNQPNTFWFIERFLLNFQSNWLKS